MKDYSSELFPYAYNILGTKDDAKDAVQDVLYKYLSSPGKDIGDEKSYLIRGVINQAINIKRKQKRVVPDGPWLPEPIATEEADKNLHLSDIVSYSMMVLMEQLSPKERAVFILKEAFGYSHDDIAHVLSATAEGSRKLLSRAKTKLDASIPAIGKEGLDLHHRQPASFPTELLDKFIGAIRGGDVHTLEDLLTEDIRFSADSGGKLKLVSRLTEGRTPVAELLIFVFHKYQRKSTIVPTIINHQPAFLYYNKGLLVACQVFRLSPEGDRIIRIENLIDPDKLKAISAAG